MDHWHHRPLRLVEAAGTKPHTFLAGPDEDVWGEPQWRQPRFLTFLITCYIRSCSLHWLTKPPGLVPSLLWLKPYQTLQSLFWMELMCAVQPFSMSCTAKPAIFCSFFNAISTTPVLQPAAVWSMPLWSAVCSAHHSQDFRLYFSEKEIPSIHACEVFFFLCLKLAFMICLLLDKHIQRAG